MYNFIVDITIVKFNIVKMSTTYEMNGFLRVKEDEQQISDKFKKREFVIEVENERNSDWNDFVKFQLTQDRCNIIDDFNINSEIKVFFNIRGRKFEKDGKMNYFSNIEAWKVERFRSDDSPQQEVHQNEMPGAPEEDDLPF